LATGNRKRSATGKKSSSGRKTNSGHKRNTKKQQEREAEFTREVILWIVVAVSLLLFISNFVWLGSHYRRRFRADNAIAAACYFAGHFLIVRSLYL